MKTRNKDRAAPARMMGIDELCAYLSLGRTTARKFAEDAGAVRKIGRRLLFDRRAIDRAIDGLL